MFRVFVERAVVFIKGAVTFIGGAVIFIWGAMIFIGGAVTFIGKGSLAVEGRLFKTAGVRVVNIIKGVNRRDLRRWLIMYELKGPLLLINNLISVFNYSV